MPAVAIAHTKEKHRSFENVLGLVAEAIGHLGGMEAFVKPGQSVLIKPDQSIPCSAEDGCTTDPLVVGALIRLARNAGAGKVLVGESSDGPFDSLECMRITGVAAIAAREGAELVDLGTAPSQEVVLPEGRLLHHAPLPEPLLAADVIIAAPKAKNHYLDFVCGAMHGWMGVVNQHWRAATLNEADVIGRFADIVAFMRPDLCVADALICGEGDGPAAATPRWCGCILASADPVALDASIARLMGRDPQRLRFAAEGAERGAGRLAPVVWVGTPMEHVAFESWPGREGFSHLPLRVLAGRGVTQAGTLGHLKSALDLLLRRGVLEQALRRGTPTIMAGDIEDPDFDRHVEQGPYVVVDDSARPEYKNDPRVCFVPGHPVLHEAFPELVRAFGIDAAEQRASIAPWTALAVGAGLALGSLVRRWGRLQPDR
jgi:uncharacterized protein (DUF362 family)